MKEISFGKPIIGDEEKCAVIEVLNSGLYVHGQKTDEFEKIFSNFTGAPYTLSTNSCTAALHLASLYFNLGQGDEVIVPAMTHVATVHAIEYVGAKPIFIDAEPKTGNIDLEKIEDKISEKTRAISIVHYLGRMVDMDFINQLAKKYNLHVIEDAALAIGSRYKGTHAGLCGDIGCFSFYPVKQITTLEGGVAITKHKELAQKINYLKCFGVDKTLNERSKEGQYDVKHLGYNFRMNEVEAAIGIEQIKKLPTFLKTRKNNFEILETLLSPIDELRVLKTGTEGYFESSHYCLSIILHPRLERDIIAKKLKEKGIGTSVYYPRPVPQMSYYADKYKIPSSQFKIASEISNQSIALPVGPHLNTNDMIKISKAIKEVIK